MFLPVPCVWHSLAIKSTWHAYLQTFIISYWPFDKPFESKDHYKVNMYFLHIPSNSDYCSKIIWYKGIQLRFFIDAISQNFASCRKKRRQEQSGTYERYQQDQKRRQRMKRVWISLTLLTNYLTLSLSIVFPPKTTSCSFGHFKGWHNKRSKRVK